MTTDITELAQSLKAAAENATPGEWCSDDQYGIVADAGLNGNYYIASCSGPEHRSNKRFIALANPANVLALVEALEKAQQYSKERDAENQNLMLTVGRLRVEREELESRTVKLPNSNDERFWGYGSEFEVKLYDSCVFYALTAAGIKWEAE
ncbi:ead/Ea22-like family protein [Raoultella ornithinolytica]|uniref:ead/Ea22-like family protein n=1 Tax=Raoultella ornithinolytica TaxID=54291 RepID=UPI003749D5FF